MNKKKILIIDDEPDFCLLLKSYFSNRHYEVYYSYSLTNGMQLLKDVEPDILFLDNNLPDGKGWNEADQIIQQYPKIQVNLISTHQYETYKKEHASVRIWEKPLQLNELGKIF